MCRRTGRREYHTLVVASNVLGVSGRNMLEAMIQGESDPSAGRVCTKEAIGEDAKRK